jgi:hypothetical protein
MGLETHEVYAMGYMNPATHIFSISALIVMQLWMGEVVITFDVLGRHQAKW